MIPFDRPLIALQQYSPGMLPRPNFNIPPAMLERVDEAASVIINHCVQTASRSAVRMFCLNTLVSNNFQNNQYPRIIELTLRRAAQLAATNNNPLNLAFYIPNAAENVIQLFLSQLVVSTPQLLQMLSPQDQANAHSNFQQMPQFEAALMNMNLSIYMNPSTQSYQPPAAAPMYNNYQPHFRDTPPASVNPGSSSMGSQWEVLPAAAPPNPALQQNNYFAPGEVRAPTAPVYTAPVEMLQTTNHYNQPTTPTPTPTAEPQIQAIQPATTPFHRSSPLTCKGQTEMDINVHSIPYFGSNINVDLSSRRLDFKGDVLALNKASAENKAVGPVLLNTNFQVEIGLEDAMLEASKMLNKNRTDEVAPTVYRFFSVVLTPRVCINGVEQVLEAIAEAKHLGDAVTAIRSGYGKLFKDPTNPSLVEQNFLNSLAFLDRRLTVLINDFLKYNMRSDYRVDSFSEDYTDLCGVIQTKLGDVYSDIFSSWCARLHSAIRVFMKEHGDNARKVVESYLDEADVSFVYIPSFESVTFLSMTAKELSYTVQSPQGHQIDPRNTPVLNDLVETLMKNKKDRSIFTTRDWLVTADDHRYILANNAIEPGAWFIYST